MQIRRFCVRWLAIVTTERMIGPDVTEYQRAAPTAEPVPQVIAGSVLQRCASRHLLQVAALGRTALVVRSADGLRLLGTRSGISARSGLDQLV
jgi:hypothetical protein